MGKQYSKINNIIAFITLFISFLIGQPKSKIVHVDVISESERMEAKFIFDEVIDRDDVSGWIDRNNYFTLSLFNVSFEKFF